MIKKIKAAAISLVLVAGFFAGGATAFAKCEPGKGSLPPAVFVPWYEYLEGEDVGGKCKPVLGDDYVKSVSLIGLAVIGTLMRISGILATAYLIWGAIQYITSQGDQNGIANAKNTILNAIVGLVIVLLSIGIVQFVGNLARSSP